MEQRYQLFDRVSGDRLTLLTDDRGRVHLRVRVDATPAVTLVLVRREDVGALAHELLALSREETSRPARLPRKVAL